MSDHVHDFVAIGLGPFNLGLACLTDPVDDLDGVFLEAKTSFSWHPGMMLDGVHLQTPFMADLVTMADPTSPFSFLAYAKEQGRLYAFYIRENFYLLREEYVQYCRWAADRLRTIEWDRAVAEVVHEDGVYVVRSRDSSGRAHEHRGRRLVIGTGTPPHVPAAAEGLEGPVLHSSDYLHRADELKALGSVTVVGSGQSAAEVYRDLLQDLPRHRYRLTWATRSPRFFPLEYTKLTLEMTSPEYTDYFHALPPATRDELLESQKQLYKGIDGELVDEIHELLYAAGLRGEPDTELLTNTELESASWDGSAFTLGLRQVEQDVAYDLRTEGLVLATGHRWRRPDFVDGIADRLCFDDRGRFDVDRTYAVDRGRDEVFVQNAESHTHGLVAPDLGMASYRNSVIIARMLGREVYPVEKRIAFQQFGAPARAVHA
ncbi:lysine N(6)-hydroxylase/L-ornithine N(5)-oxygenase family protein [Solicola sp. PLA-1-18]|uniref:lysine N(6)-hydroxylase/L-ornithine N(5)-oxygenase family protein n=1 Tax=Solicola sp. PLA-1-18 TaxID=3380532 RepID=UPI003B76DDB4